MVLASGFRGSSLRLPLSGVVYCEIATRTLDTASPVTRRGTEGGQGSEEVPITCHGHKTLPSPPSRFSIGYLPLSKSGPTLYIAIGQVLGTHLGRRSTPTAVPTILLATGVTFANPKSRILACPLCVTKMFAGLMSRCTMPAACAASSASAISIPSESTVSTSYGFPAICAFKVIPSRNSITMND